jgi:pyruvate dehydrogenase E2 component (dihydrolipoamide acetyltransferase)
VVTKVVLAKLSPTMEEGTIVKWTKKEGDTVKQGDVLAEIETDKANMEMEALGSGVLRKILVQAGGKAPVGSLIGVIAEPNEDISKLTGAAAPAAAPPPAAPQKAASGSAEAAAAKASAPGQGQPAPAPSPTAAAASAATKAAPADQSASVAEAEKTPAVNAPAGGPPPAPAAAPPRAPAGEGEGGRVKASPLARSMAAQQNIPLASVSGSGPGGRIIKRDIEAWSASGQPAAAAAATGPAAPAGPALAAGQEIPLSNMRKVIARRLSESAFTAPHFYVTMEVDMGAAMSLREQVNAAAEAKVSVNDLIVKACAKALTRHPMVNASWAEDKIVTFGQVDVGIAVSIPDGLITPVVRGADRKTVVEIAREAKDLATRARERKLKPEEYTNATFTISNLGMMGVTEFTAIINPPGSAILAVGAVRKVPVVVDDEVTVGQRMNLTLSCDHRVVDGALGAQFLGEVRRLLESPLLLLI